MSREGRGHESREATFRATVVNGKFFSCSVTIALEEVSMDC